MIVKRELTFLTIFYIAGILIGKFLNWTTSLIVVLFYFFVCLIMIKRYNLKQYMLLLISCFCLITGCFNTLMKNEYNFNEKNTKFTGTIIEISKIQPDRASYVVKLENNINVLLNVYAKSKFRVFDRISFNGNLIKPKNNSNIGGFNYKNYLISKNIYTIINTNQQPNFIGKDNSNIFLGYCLKLKNKIIDIINITMSGIQQEIFKGIILGETNGFTDDLQQEFMNSGLTHLLAVSGSNVGLIIAFVLYILNLLRLNKKLSKLLAIFVVVIFAIITGLTPSVVRASIMAIVVLTAYILMRKPDTLTSIAFSGLIILLFNPYVLFDVGFLLTFIGTIGIVLYYRTIYEYIKKYIKIYLFTEIVSMTVAVQLFITPITMYYFNRISLVGFISNIIAIPIASAAVMFGFITCCVGLISIPIAQIFANVSYIFITLLYYISKFFSNFKILNITVITPNILSIVTFYVILILGLYKDKFILRNFKKYLKYALFVFLIIIILKTFIPKPLEVTFVDVGQGDCIFVKSPENKIMMIDGGGNFEPNQKYNIGMSIVVPFLLDSGVRELDTIILTHSHNDHLEGLIDVVENFKVNNIVYGVYDNNNTDFKKLIKLCKDKGTKIFRTTNGDNIQFTKEIGLNILNPQKDLQYLEQNDNSIVARLTYGKRSILFTGDISQNIEQILNDKLSKNILKCDILKVAHHGSKTSSNKALLDNINPSISVISVGRNKFGHPNIDVIKRLEDINSKIYRTDKNGQITIKIYKNGKIIVTKMLKNDV